MIASPKNVVFGSLTPPSAARRTFVRRLVSRNFMRYRILGGTRGRRRIRDLARIFSFFHAGLFVKHGDNAWLNQPNCASE